MQENNKADLAFMLGRIQGDVKHILEALTRNQRQFETVNSRLTDMDDRLDKVEKFNVKVITIASIVVPLLMVALNAGLAFLGL
ncbi:hypothetical protein HOR19_gp46 [Phage MedPE-SWcel-C56]|uniref:Uncharacterized protein n=1 Tax=Phage MedPE-SWcel-C56 TaxID=1871314 RepID=A0A1B1IY40_9CAUD|nr:hypothetical protein HOR19_gp46 [Phage MedPE-SWcel-C56]ANS06239.1 hypothetical protein [Phage MedPE-SWcel-C56]